MLGNVIHDSLDQAFYAGERFSANPFVRNLSEPSLHQVQPRTAGWNEVDVEARVLAEPFLYLGMLMCAVVVDNQVQIQLRRRLLVNQLQKLDPFLMPVPRHARSDQPALGHLQGREERCGAVADVIVRHRTTAALLQRQARLGAVQGLNLALLVNAQNQGMLRGIEKG